VTGSIAFRIPERMLAPMPRETLFAHLQEGRGLVAARVVDRHRERRELLRLGDEVLGVLSARCIATDISPSPPHPSIRWQWPGISAHSAPQSPPDVRLLRSARDGCAQAARCAHAHNEYARLRHFSAVGPSLPPIRRSQRCFNRSVLIEPHATLDRLPAGREDLFRQLRISDGAR
jgi:hypothetical protein